jgi:hypothetical protein
VTNPDGTERARFTGEDVFNGIDGQVVHSGDNGSEWSILTTADGSSFSVEPVADLLGVEPSAIGSVSRVSTDGTKVVVTVSLNERWPDESRKQVVLVGTPKG